MNKTKQQEYKTPKSSLVSRAIEITDLADRIAEAIEKDGFGRARLLVDDLLLEIETLQGQLDTR